MISLCWNQYFLLLGFFIRDTISGVEISALMNGTSSGDFFWAFGRDRENPAVPQNDRLVDMTNFAFCETLYTTIAITAVFH